MGWVTDEEGHEGWPAALFADGARSVGTQDQQAVVELPNGEEELRDGEEATGWQARCECGWVGPVWSRVAVSSQDDRSRRRVYVSTPSIYGSAPEEVEEAMDREWRQHAEQGRVLEAVRQQAREVAAAQARLGEAVRAARGAGRSWAEVGEATGMSRQAAHERWSKAWG